MSVDGGASTPNGQSFAVPAAGLALTGATERCVDGGTLVTLVWAITSCGTPYARYPIALASLALGHGLTDPLRVDVSSSELVREGALQADGSDLAVVASDGVTPLLVFADTPVGPDQRLFVRWPAGDGGLDSLGNQVDPGPFAVGAPREVAGGLGAVFPELADGGLLLWLRAEVSDVGDGGGASVRPDSARGSTAVAGNGAATWQANGIGDWPALDFNGSSDEYDVGAGLGVGSFTLFAVYWDPDGRWDDLSTPGLRCARGRDRLRRRRDRPVGPARCHHRPGDAAAHASARSGPTRPTAPTPPTSASQPPAAPTPAASTAVCSPR